MVRKKYPPVRSGQVVALPEGIKGTVNWATLNMVSVQTEKGLRYLQPQDFATSLRQVAKSVKKR